MFRSVLVETCSVVKGIVTFVVDDDVRLSVFNMYHSGMNSVKKHVRTIIITFSLACMVFKRRCLLKEDSRSGMSKGNASANQLSR